MMFTSGLDKSCKLASPLKSPSEEMGEQLNSVSITASFQGLSYCEKEQRKEQRKTATGS